MQWVRGRFFGISFFGLGLLLAVYAVSRGGWWLGLFWPAVSLLVAGAGYLWLGHWVFGKQPNGERHAVSRVILAPYCGATWLGWRFLRFVVKEDCWNEAAPRIYIGRRAYAEELPADVTMIVDLTSEFVEPIAVRTGRKYRSFPILDAGVPQSNQAVLSLVQELAGSDETLYIHCAEGHGRAAMITALLLIERGHADDVDSALAMLEAVRPKVKLRPFQREALERCVSLRANATTTHGSESSEKSTPIDPSDDGSH